MREKMGNLRRTHMCGNLRIENVGRSNFNGMGTKRAKLRFFNIC